MSICETHGDPARGIPEKRMLLKKLDPRAKTLACLFALVGLGGAVSWAFWVWTLVVAGFIVSDAKLREMAGFLKPVALLCLFGLLLHGLFTPGDRFYPPLPFTGAGLLLGAKLASQLLAAAALAGLLALTTTSGEVVASLSWLCGPLGRFGLPVEDFFRTVALALALIPTLRVAGRGLLGKPQAAGSGPIMAHLEHASALLGHYLSTAERAALASRNTCYSENFRQSWSDEWLALGVSLIVCSLTLAMP